MFDFYGKLVGKYTSPMDPYGKGKQTQLPNDESLFESWKVFSFTVMCQFLTSEDIHSDLESIFSKFILRLSKVTYFVGRRWNASSIFKETLRKDFNWMQILL